MYSFFMQPYAAIKMCQMYTVMRHKYNHIKLFVCFWAFFLGLSESWDNVFYVFTLRYLHIEV